MIFFILVVGGVCILSGAVVARMAQRNPAHARSMEILGGILLIAGLAMLGFELEPILEAVH